MLQFQHWLHTNDIPLQELQAQWLQEKAVRLHVLRLDEVHPVISGNKLFKLHYFLQLAKATPGKAISTFGGAYSNHLVATAYACKMNNIPCTGFVRGEKPATLSRTLQQCDEFGMQLRFLHRGEYAERCGLFEQHEHEIVVPEGGYHPLGAMGAALIMPYLELLQPSHICVDIGTATTLAGIIMEAGPRQKIEAIPVLKGLTDIPARLKYLTGRSAFSNLTVHDDYHFGGYAKYNAQLLDFMNDLYRSFRLPTDFVYTAKQAYAVFKLVEQNYFVPGSNIVFIHSGGLQGNASLPAGSLIF